MLIVMKKIIKVSRMNSNVLENITLDFITLILLFCLI